MGRNKTVRALKAWAVCVAFVMAGVAQQPARPAGDFEISGTLLDATSGQPLARGRVTIAPVTKRDDLTTVISGDDGAFTFTGLAPGMYTLTGWARGYILQF